MKDEMQPVETVTLKENKNESLTGSLQIENALKVWDNTENVGSTDRGSVYSDTP